MPWPCFFQSFEITLQLLHGLEELGIVVAWRAFLRPVHSMEEADENWQNRNESVQVYQNNSGISLKSKTKPLEGLLADAKITKRLVCLR